MSDTVRRNISGYNNSRAGASNTGEGKDPAAWEAVLNGIQGQQDPNLP